MNGEDCCRGIACASEGYETWNVGDRVDPRPFYEKVENVNVNDGRKASENIDGGGSFGVPGHIGGHEVHEGTVKDCGMGIWSKIHPGVSLFLSPARGPHYDDVSVSFRGPLLDPASCSSSCSSCPFPCAM
jgi:hypothetical protein